MLVDYLGANHEEVVRELESTRMAQDMFQFLKSLYTHQLHNAEQVAADDEQAAGNGVVLKMHLQDKV